MDIQEHIAKLECFKKKLEENRPFFVSVLSIHAERSERIFTDGRNTSGGVIGNYNTTNSIYVNPKTSPRGFTPEGKPGSRVNKKDRKTKYFGSYAEFRTSIGRQAAFVDLNLWGNLKSNFENRSRGIPTPEKISNSEYHVTLDGENSKKKQGLEEKFGEVFPHTESEKENFYKTCAIELEIARKQC